MKNKYESTFPFDELKQVFYAGLNKFNYFNRYKWYIIDGFQEMVTGTYQIVEDIWSIMSNQPFCSIIKGSKAITRHQQEDIS